MSGAICRNEVMSINEHALHQILASFFMPKSEMATEDLQPYLQEKSARDIGKFVIDFDKNTATEKELEEYKTRNKVRQMFALPRPHPNHMFYVEHVTNMDLNSEMRRVVPGIDQMPASISDRMNRFRMKLKKGKGKQKLQPLPSPWR